MPDTETTANESTEEQPDSIDSASKSENSFDDKDLMNLIFNQMLLGSRDDKRIMLLNSIKPFVSEKRQKGIDDCIRIMNMVAFFESFMSKAGK